MLRSRLQPSGAAVAAGTFRVEYFAPRSNADEGSPISGRHWHCRTACVRRHCPTSDGRTERLFGRSVFADGNLGSSFLRIAAADLPSRLCLSCICSAAITRERKSSNSERPEASSSQRWFRTAVRSQVPIVGPPSPDRPGKLCKRENAVAGGQFLLKVQCRDRGGVRCKMAQWPKCRERVEGSASRDTIDRSGYRQ